MKVSACAEKKLGLGRRDIPRNNAHPLRARARHPPLDTGMPSGKLEKERTPWAWKGPLERAALGNLISHIRSRVHVGLGDETGFRAVKGGHRRGESHCKRMLHVLREGHRAGMDHCIIRECNSYTHCPGEEGSCLHLSESTQ